MSSSPSNPVPPLHRWYVWTVLALIMLAATTAITLRWLAPYVAVKVGNRPIAMSVIPTPEAKIPEAWKKLIDEAQSSISLSTTEVDNRVLAGALHAAAARGVQVAIIIPPLLKDTPNEAFLRWLRDQKSAIDVASDPAPFSGTMCVIDNRIALVTAQPLAANGAMVRSAGFFASFTDPAVIQMINSQIRAQALRSRNK